MFVMRRFLWFVLIPVLANVAWSSPLADQAETAWRNRHIGAVDGQADPVRSQQIVTAFQGAVDADTTDQESATGLIRAYFFMAYFADSNRTRQLDVVKRGLEASETLLKRQPKNAGLLAWSSMLWARYAELAGILTVARKGTADKIRDLAMRSYQIDAKYNNGSALRMLGVVHAEAPYIPFVLTWPDVAKADNYFQKALAVAPHNSLTLYMYGDYLQRVGRKTEAQAYYQKALGVPVEPANQTEEILFRNRIKARLKTLGG